MPKRLARRRADRRNIEVISFGIFTGRMSFGQRGHMHRPEETRTRVGDRSFSAAGPRIWNSLPPDLRRPDIELGEFRRLLKTFLLV